MKIAVTSTGPSLDDQVETRFGRTPYYVFVDTETMEFEAMENPNVAAGGGAGIKSAQLMSDHGVQYVLTGNCGPNAFNVFGAAGIQVIAGVTGTVRQAVDQFKAGAFPTSSRPSVASHFGMSGGRGMGRVQGSVSPLPAQQKPATGEDVDTLWEEARILEKQLEDIRRRIDQAGKSKGVAQVDSQLCSGCGVCADSCPVDAITVNGVASIDVNRCTGCGECIDRCPLEAITII